MRRLISLILVLFCGVVLFVACKGDTMENLSDNTAEWDYGDDVCPYALMHDGFVYYDTNVKIDEKIKITEEAVLGRVTSVVPENKMPAIDGQANFNILGNIYTTNFITGNGLLVQIYGDWFIFERRDERSVDEEICVSPPDLKVISPTSGESVNAMKGTYSWLYENENGEESGICADALHPLQAREYLPDVVITPSYYSSIYPGSVYLTLDNPPDSLSIVAWDAKDFGNTAAEATQVTVNRHEDVKGDGKTVGSFSFVSLNGEYVYEAVAEWNDSSGSKYYGTVSYAFVVRWSLPTIPDSFTEIQQ